MTTQTESPPQVDLFAGAPVNAGDLAVTGQSLGLRIPVGSPRGAKTTILKIIDKMLGDEQAAALQAVENALEGNELVENALAVRDFFKNAPEGAQLRVMNTQKPREAVAGIIEQVSESNKMIEIAVIEDLDPEVEETDGAAGQEPFLPVNPLCEKIAAADEEGVKVHVLGGIKEQTYEGLAKVLNKHPFLGEKPGRDSIQLIAGRVYEKEFDPHMVTKHSPLGAALGKRLGLDSCYGVAEPMAGRRCDGDGPKGEFLGLHVAPQPARRVNFSKAQRRNLAKHGINTLRRWDEYGCILTSNRSLLAGDESPYIFASTTRLRQYVSAMFHETVEIEVENDGRRSKGRLELVIGKMLGLFKKLRDEGWLEDYDVVPDYREMTVRIKVLFVPVLPIDSILIEYEEERKVDDA